MPIILPETIIDALFNETKAFIGFQLQIDLQRQLIISPSGNATEFEIEPFRKHCLFNGLDDIGLTLRSADKIREFEARHLAAQPWLANTI